MVFVHPTATCTTTFQITEPYHDEIDHSNCILVHLYFTNWREVHHTINCPCQSNRFAITRETIDDDSTNYYHSDLVCLKFPLNPTKLEVNVLNAESKQGLPNYVTPKVWSFVKEKVLSFLRRHVYFDSTLGYKITAVVDVSTIHLVDRDNNDKDEDEDEEEEEEDDYEHDEWLGKVVESLPKDFLDDDRHW